MDMKSVSTETDNCNNREMVIFTLKIKRGKTGTSDGYCGFWKQESITKTER